MDGMNTFTRFALITSLVVTPAVAAAQTADVQAQIQAMLQQVAALQAQLGVAGTGSSDSANTAPAMSQGSTQVYADCPRVSRVLKKGMSGDDVTRLQTFLSADPAIYPEGTVSGFFGSATERAVQKWQARYKIVQSGTPSSTGYGVVGPRTASLMALQCSGGVSAQVGGFIKVTPISGPAPLVVSVETTINTTHSCGAASYALNWGDGSAPMNIPISAGVCQEMKQTYSHTYSYGGVYGVTLSAGGHTTSATVAVSGATAGGQSQGTGMTGTTDSLAVTTSSGSAPFTATLSGTVNANASCGGGFYTLLFGDAQSVSISYPASCTAQPYSVQHQYVSAGTYTANLFRGAAGSSGALIASATISATSATAGLSAPSIVPNVGNNPLAITLQYDVSSCNGYDVDWGDGSSHATQSSAGTSCAGAVGTKNLGHTYAGAGSYTVTVKRGNSLERTDTLSISISN